MKNLFISFAAVLVVVLAGCNSTEGEGRGLRPNPVTQGEPSPETPPDERISSLLQESKQQYDDGHYATAFHMAEQVESLIVEHEFPDEFRAVALNIQGFSLLQIGRIEDYYVKAFGTQHGAIRKFEGVLEIRPDDFRAKLGLGLARFRRHGDSVRKAESLGEGVVFLAGIREDFRRGYEADDRREAEKLFKEAARKLTVFRSNRTQLHELKYIFRDPSTVKPGPDAFEKADWLGPLGPEGSELAILDLEAILDDAVAGDLTEEDRKLFDTQSERVTKSWRTVRKYWRQRALTDLQVARDELLTIRKTQMEANDNEVPYYFWIDRDLAFVFQSLGAFFLDSGLERARLIAIAQGITGDELEDKARRIYIDDDYEDWQKTESRRNYEAALSFTKSFIRAHSTIERLRRERKDDAELAVSDNANPFLVDLVTRFRRTMDTLIQEDLDIRQQMVLEAAALCIDPLFQINDIQQANTWANEFKANNPSNPLHHFVRATAYYQDERWEDARHEYQAFMRDSSPVEDGNRRSRARKRIMQCDNFIARTAGAGEGAGR